MNLFNDDSFEFDRKYYKNESIQFNYDNYEEISKAINDNFVWDQYQKEKKESSLNESTRPDLSINFKPKISSEAIFLVEKIENRKTKPTTITKSIIELEKKLPENPCLIINEKIKTHHPLKLLNKKRGRKSNNIDLKKGNVHGKFAEDNIMKKIKTHIMNHIVNSLNDSLKDKTYEFYRIDSSLAENLKKDFNLELMDKTIYNIFMNNKLSNKYRKKKKIYSNSFLIKKIYNEKVEIKTMEILEKKYINIINEVQQNCLNEFLKKIEEKEKENISQDVDEYMETLKNLLMDYENWFKNKKGRDKRKSKKS